MLASRYNHIIDTTQTYLVLFVDLSLLQTPAIVSVNDFPLGEDIQPGDSRANFGELASAMRSLAENVRTPVERQA